MKTIIKISTEVYAPLNQVWGAWTTASHIVNWYFASDTWECPTAEVDLKEGGRFNYHMAAKDGSMSFNFSGTFDKILKMHLLVFTLDDGREVSVFFEQKDKYVLVTEEFEAEENNSSERQKEGWQAILDNFKKYTEDLNTIEQLEFEIKIAATVEKVYQKMLAQNTYKLWTAPFQPTSFYRGNWEQGSKMLFLGTDKDGNEGGMVARIKRVIPNQIVTIEHYGFYDKGEEIIDGAEVSSWAGAIEEYRFDYMDGITTVKVLTDTNKEYKNHFMEAWPKGLAILKSICEQ